MDNKTFEKAQNLILYINEIKKAQKTIGKLQYLNHEPVKISLCDGFSTFNNENTYSSFVITDKKTRDEIVEAVRKVVEERLKKLEDQFQTL